MQPKLSPRLTALVALVTACGKKVEMREPPADAVAPALAASQPHALGTAAAAPSAPAIDPGLAKPIQIHAFLREVKALGRKGTLINAFASWCGPCREEVPLLESMAENLARDGINLVFVSFDEPEDRYKAAAFLRANDVRSPSFLALDALAFRQRLAPNWPGMIPATLLYDATPRLRYLWGGPAYEDEIMPIVEGFLAGKAIDGQANFSLTPGKDLTK